MEIYEEAETPVLGTPTRLDTTRRFGPQSASKRSGRTPLKPHNHQSPYHRSLPRSPMQEVRRFLKGTAGRGNVTRNGNIDHKETDHAKKKSASTARLAYPKTSSTSNTTTATEVSSTKKGNRVKWGKETDSRSPSNTTNRQQMASSMMSPTTATASAIRRQLRSTMSPKNIGSSSKKKERGHVTESSSAVMSLQGSDVELKKQHSSNILKTTTGLAGRTGRLLGRGGTSGANGTSSIVSTKMGPPQRMLPKTPNSLLRTELNSTTYEEDESLLVSPPANLWRALNVPDSTGLVIVSPAAVAALNKSSSSGSSSSRKNQHQMRNKRSPRSEPSPPLQPRALLSSPPEEEKKFDYIDDRQARNPSSPLSPRETQPAKSLSKSEPNSVVNSNHSLPTAQTGISSEGVDKTADVSNASKAEQLRETKRSTSVQSASLANEEPTQTASKFKSSKSLKGRSTLRADLAKARKALPQNVQATSIKPSNGESSGRSSEEAGKKGAGFFVELSNALPDKKSQAVPQSKLDGSENKIGAMDFSDLFLENSSVVTKGKSLISNEENKDDETPLSSVVQSNPRAKSSLRKGIAFQVPVLGSKDKVQRKTKKSTAPTANSYEKQKQQKMNTWAESQSETFVSWLNYTFDPTEVEAQTDLGATSSSSHTSGLRTLYLHRQLAQSRMKGSDIFRSASMSSIRKKIFDEIVKGRLALRSDRDIYADLSLRKQIVSLLLSYTTPWLRLGIEIIFGEVFSFEIPINEASSPDMTKKGNAKPGSQMRGRLQQFIKNRVLSDATVLAKYTRGKCKVPSGRFEKEYRAEMRELILYRLMVLIFYLDRAKEANVLDKVPRLFTKSSTVKSSSEVLLALCRDFLSSEGNFIKHLSRIGLSVSYKQDRLDEVEFHTSNLAVDLRDGVRLTRMAEILTEVPPKSLMRSLRLPAVSRLQKLHNVGVAMLSLRQFGVDITKDIQTHHIVDGHREIVLKLMWSVIAHSCMHKLLQKDQVEQEILNVVRSNQARRKVEGRPALQNPEVELLHGAIENSSPEVVLKSLLFRWCRAVCSCFDFEITDLTTSFADGTAFCYLVHYYHPSVIKLEEVLPTADGDPQGAFSLTLLANARKNSTMAGKRVSDLGGIPHMIPITDQNNPPDEKCTLVCLAYLCSRLAESSKEIFASILIQACYRNYRKREAARKIFRAWLRNKDAYYNAQRRRFADAVAIIEDFAFVHKHAIIRLRRTREIREQRYSSSVLIQKLFRGLLGRLRFNDIKEKYLAAIRIQSQWRFCLANKEALRRTIRRDAACLIQRVWRGYDRRMDIEFTFNAAVELQRFLRGFVAKLELQRLRAAATKKNSATVIQCAWRRLLARTEAAVRMLHRDAARELQRFWRGCYHRMVFELSVQSAIMIQKIMRGRVARRKVAFDRCRNSATLIQSKWRSFSAQVQFELDLMDIVSIQSLVRRRSAQKEVRQREWAIGTLQRSFRSELARREVQEKRDEQELACQQQFAAIVMQVCRMWPLLGFRCNCPLTPLLVSQNAIRVWSSKQRFQRLLLRCRCSTLIQSSWRRHVQARKFAKIIRAVLDLQSLHRGVSIRREISLQVASATRLQTEWRRYWAQYNYNLDVLEIIIVQSAIRRRLAMNVISRRGSAILTIQRSIRRHQAKLSASRLLSSVIAIQAFSRRLLANFQVTERQNAILLIQAAARSRFAFKNLSESRQAIQKIQCFLRQSQAKALASRKRAAVVEIQTAVRRWVAVIDIWKRRRAILTIQTLARMRINVVYASHRRAAVLVIQTSARRRLALQKMKLLRKLQLEGQATLKAAIFCQVGYNFQFCWQFAPLNIPSPFLLCVCVWVCFSSHVPDAPSRSLKGGVENG